MQASVTSSICEFIQYNNLCLFCLIQVVAIVMDMFTDVDIFREIVEASARGIAVYILLDESNFSHFLKMTEKQGCQVQRLRVRHPIFLCRNIHFLLLHSPLKSDYYWKIVIIEYWFLKLTIRCKYVSSQQNFLYRYIFLKASFSSFRARVFDRMT